MATAFGLSGLRDKISDWRGSWKNIAPPSLQLVKAKPAFDDRRRGGDEVDLSCLIENLVIPKLIANRPDGTPNRSSAARPSLSLVAQVSGDDSSLKQPAFSEADILEFARLSLRDSPGEMLNFVDAHLAKGRSVETIYVELLAPAARKLGSDWEEDSQDFVDVTMGLWRIQEILRELSSRVPPTPRGFAHQRSALFSTLPGEQHSFGTLMIAECFERAGWHTEVLIEPTQSELNAKCAGQHFDLVGLTVSRDCPTAKLRGVVSSIKTIGHNAETRILLGGRFINEHPGLVRECGADGTASDALSAVSLADQLVPAKQHCT